MRIALLLILLFNATAAFANKAPADWIVISGRFTEGDWIRVMNEPESRDMFALCSDDDLFLRIQHEGKYTEIPWSCIFDHYDCMHQRTKNHKRKGQ